MDILQGEIGSEITVQSLIGKESIMINSPGGSLFEGLAMFDYVKANNIEIGVIGLCASSATLPLIASANRWGTPNSRYLIHNPSLSYFFETKQAEELTKEAQQLMQEQERAASLYSDVLKKSKEEIQTLMNEDRIIDAKEALVLGLILEIRNIEEDTSIEIENDYKQLYNKFKRQIDNKKQSEMDNKEIKGQLTGIRALLNNIFKMVHPKMLVLQDVNGVELDFGSDIDTPDQVVIGVSATVDGSPAQGNYIMPSGETYVFDAGVLKEIQEPTSNSDEQLKKENEDLKVENEILKEEIEAKDKRMKDIEAKLKSVSMKLDEIESKFTDEKPTITVPPVKNEVKTGFSYTRKN